MDYNREDRTPPTSNDKLTWVAEGEIGGRCKCFYFVLTLVRENHILVSEKEWKSQGILKLIFCVNHVMDTVHSINVSYI